RGELVVPPFVVGTAGEGVTRLRFDPNRPVTSDLTAVTDRPRTPLVCEGQGGLTGFCDLVLEVEAGAAYSMSAVPTDDGFSITFWEAATYRRLPFVVTPSLQGWFPELP